MMNKYQEALISLCKKCNKNYCKQFTSYNCESKIILQELVGLAILTHFGDDDYIPNKDNVDRIISETKSWNDLQNRFVKTDKALDKAIDLLTNYDEDKFHRIACNDKCKYHEECMKADGDCLLIIRNEDKEETKRRLLEDD